MVVRWRHRASCSVEQLQPEDAHHHFCQPLERNAANKKKFKKNINKSDFQGISNLKEKSEESQRETGFRLLHAYFHSFFSSELAVQYFVKQSELLIVSYAASVFLLCFVQLSMLMPVKRCSSGLCSVCYIINWSPVTLSVHFFCFVFFFLCDFCGRRRREEQHKLSCCCVSSQPQKHKRLKTLDWEY